MIALLFISSASVYSQYVEDALRYGLPNGLITPRVAGLNVAYHGVADDMGALFYNPAGMILVKSNELSMGLNFQVNSVESMYKNNLDEFSSNNEGITNVGLISSFDRQGGKKSAIGIAYYKESDFYNTFDYAGFNEQSTLIANQTKNWQYDDPNDNWVNRLRLAENGYTPYEDSLFQRGQIDSRGGIHTITGGAAFEVNEYVSLGFALTGKWGGFTYDKSYYETDIHNNYNTVGREPYEDLHELEFIETVDQDVAGFSATLGIQARIEDFMRFGASVKLPTWYQVDETYKQDVNLTFDDNSNSNFSTGTVPNSYKITTPFIYSAGFSFHALGLTFASGIEYSDVSQLEFSDAMFDVESLNKIIVRELVGQTTWGFGLEYQLPWLPFMARASYASTTSPYQQDIANAAKSWLSLGGSVFLGEKVRLDAVMRWTDLSEQRVNYGSINDPENYSTYIITQKPLNISLGLTYRY